MRTNGWLSRTVFAGVLLLATPGIYGPISYSVAQRGREIGVRIALGATAGAIRKSVVGDGLRPTGIGPVIGLAGAIGIGQVAAPVLYGISPLDSVTLITVFPGAANTCPVTYLRRS